MWRWMVIGAVVVTGCDNPFVGTPDGFADCFFGCEDAGAPDEACNVWLNLGCPTGQKCTWIRVSVAPPLGRVGCVADGAAPVDGDCEYGAAGAVTGYDNCAAGAICVADPELDQASGTCQPICSLLDASAPCSDGFACRSRYRFFSNSDTEFPLAGVCDETCDPLSGRRDVDGARACGGPTDPLDPDALGCYGMPSADTRPTTFVCEDAGLGGHRAVVTAPGNSCASGLMPVLYESSTSTQIVCIATCRPTDCNTTIRATDPTCYRGQAPYRTIDRGCTEPGEECRYLWWFEDETTPFSAASDEVGFCVDHTKYDWAPSLRITACRNSIDTDDPGDINADFQWGCVSSASIPPGTLPRHARDIGLSLRPLP